MIGAIIGDAVGAPYEFGRKRESIKTKKFRLFGGGTFHTIRISIFGDYPAGLHQTLLCRYGTAGNGHRRLVIDIHC